MAMEAALVSVATGVLKPVIGKLTALLGNEYKRFKDVRKGIKSLTQELGAMEAFLLKMSEVEDPDPQDKFWMNEVRELSYDMEDAIDDFMQSVCDKDEKPDGFIEKIKNSLGKLGNIKSRRRIGKEIQDLKKQIKEVGDRNARYKTGVAISNSKNATVDPRALAIFENASKLVGIDEPKAEIIELLMQADVRVQQQQQRQPKIVSIVGSGGMGKTTLANQVYQELKGDYNCQVFVSVSRNPNIMNILRTIHSEVSKKDYGDTEVWSIQQLITKITESLEDKRYIVVVDDIWDVHTWDVIKHAFPMTSSSSTIISTTRIIDVAKSCHSSFIGDIYKIRPLNSVHSKELFHRRLFTSKEDLPSHLEEIFDEILKKCDGLPLAIIAISGLLANIERKEDLWNQVKNSIGRGLERNRSVEEMMNILSLSYFDLPPHLKTCLLYLSIFREDTIIKKRDLIRRWIGERFIQKEAGYTLYEIGERCFNELLNRGLIQPGKIDIYGKVKNCRVHDTILDFIISKSIEENFLTLLGVPILTVSTQSKVVRRLSVQGIKKIVSTQSKDEASKKQSKVVRQLSLQDIKERNPIVLPTYLVLSHVRSLNVFGIFIQIPSLEEFRHLHVLNLMDYSELEDHHLENIVRLFQLRYLNLKGTEIGKLPEQIGRLGCLEMLDLRKTYVQELPASIVNLKKLSHLLVDNNVKFPDGIVKMQALETLEYVRVSIQPFDFMCGLGKLKNLRNLELDLEFEFYSDTEDTNVDSDTEDTQKIREERKKAIVSSLCKLGTQNLRSLYISEGSSLLQEPLCMPTLEKLITWLSVVPRVPIWVRSLRNLQQLRIEVEGVKQDDLCMLGALPSLLLLHMDEETGSNEKLRVSGKIGFQSLRIFIYAAGSEPVDLIFGAGSMPKLEKLDLEYLGVVEADCLDFGIENLPCLNTVEFFNAHGDYGIVEDVKTAMKRAANAHPNHPILFL